MSRRQFLFYATASDLSPLLLSLEAEKKIQYTLTGLFETSEPQIYFSYADIPDFGRPNHPTAGANSPCILSPQGTALYVRPVPQIAGGIRFSISQRGNDDTVAFSPGGLYGNDVLLYGEISTISDSATSKNLYKFLAKLFRKHFTKVREFLVGPEALALSKSGLRLALSGSTPPEFDLKP